MTDSLYIKKFWIAFISLFALYTTTLTSCNNKQTKVPDNLIEANTLSQIIAEIKIIDAAYQTGTPPIKVKDSQKSTITDTIVTSEPEISKPSVLAKTIIENLNEVQSEIEENKQYKGTKSSEKKQYLGHVGADYDFIFKKYDVNLEQFNQSIDFYSRNPNLFYPILEKTLEILTHYEIQSSEK